MEDGTGAGEAGVSVARVEGAQLEGPKPRHLWQTPDGPPARHQPHPWQKDPSLPRAIARPPPTQPTHPPQVSGGNGEQVMSRDVHRMATQFDFFRLLAFYHSGCGFFVNTFLVMLSVYVNIWVILLLALVLGQGYMVSRGGPGRGCVLAVGISPRTLILST